MPSSDNGPPVRDEKKLSKLHKSIVSNVLSHDLAQPRVALVARAEHALAPSHLLTLYFLARFICKDSATQQVVVAPTCSKTGRM